MVNIRAASLALASSLTLLLPTPSAASPHVYTNMILGVGNLKYCIEHAEKIARQNGFARNIEVVGEGNMKDFHADHNDMPMAITVSCSTRLGGAAIAVAGMNNDDTYEMIKKVYKDF